MSTGFPIRIRTFTLPLAAVTLYYFSMLVVDFIFIVIFGDSVDKHEGSMEILIMLVVYGFLVSLYVFERIFYGCGAPNERKKERSAILLNLFKDRLSVKKVLMVIPISFMLMGLANLYMILIAYLSEHIDLIRIAFMDYQEMVSTNDASTGYEKYLYYIAIVIFVPIAEELIFRGVVMGEFKGTMKPWYAAVFSGVVFGMMHAQPIQVGYAMMCGVLLGFVYYYSHSIYFSIAVHAVFNFFGGCLLDIVSNMYAVAGFYLLELLMIPLGIACMILLRRQCKTNEKVKQEVCHASTAGTST